VRQKREVVEYLPTAHLGRFFFERIALLALTELPALAKLGNALFNYGRHTMQKKTIILGSESPHRRTVLQRLELEFEVIAPQIDERAIRHTDPISLTMLLAKAKAEAVVGRLAGRDSVVITADQVVVWNGKIREKPAHLDEARRFLMDYSSGEPVTHVTSVYVTEVEAGRIVRQLATVDSAYVEFFPLPEVALLGALKRGNVLRSAGAVVIEDPDVSPHVRRVWGTYGASDARSSVMGLPVFLTKHLLRHCGAI